MNAATYRVEHLMPGVTKIEGLGGEFCYLVEGRNRALLIDATVGVGDIRALCASLTSLPVSVALTHGHADHAGGAFAFDELWVHPDDLELARTPFDPAMAAQFLAGAQIPGLGIDDLTPVRDIPCHELSEGDTFDLGGCVLEVIHTPGHTRGSVCFLDRRNRQIFTGDACNINTLVCIEGQSTTIAGYLPSVRKLQGVMGDVDFYFSHHHFALLPKSCVTDVLGLCEGILDGSIQGEASSHRGMSALLAAPRDPRTRLRLDGCIGNVMFRRDMVRD